jgi:hypothetical protein
LTDIIDQIDRTDTYRVLHPENELCIFFSAVHGTFSKIELILGNKTSLSKYKKVEITPCILSNNNAIKLELNNKRNTRKYSNS